MSEVNELPQFDTELPVDKTPRIKPSLILADQHSEHPTLPPYLADALAIRKALMPARQDTKLLERPETNFTSAEHFFSSVRKNQYKSGMSTDCLSLTKG